MEYVEEVLAKLSDRQKKRIMNFSFGQMSLEEYIRTRLIKHVDEKGFVNFRGEKISLEDYVNYVIETNFTAIEKFIKSNDCDIDQFQVYLDSKVCGSKQAKSNDIDYSLTYGNTIYKNEQIEFVCIKDIIGSMWDPENLKLGEILESLYSSNRDAYSTRANNFLEKDIDYNLESIKNSEPVSLLMIGDKYYIASDGNHRVFYMLLCYLMELSKCQSDEQIQQLNNKYTFNFRVNRKSNNEMLNMVAYAMTKCFSFDFKVKIIDDLNGIYSVTSNGNEFIVSSNEELGNIVQAYLSEKKDAKLTEALHNVGFFAKVNSQEGINQMQ